MVLGHFIRKIQTSGATVALVAAGKCEHFIPKVLEILATEDKLQSPPTHRRMISHKYLDFTNSCIIAHDSMISSSIQIRGYRGFEDFEMSGPEWPSTPQSISTLLTA